ncbi:MAG: putative restriction endonuclease [Actinomycetota bacterium]|nr:putative restriction endonuclease [Actinomycetota bacterium]
MSDHTAVRIAPASADQLIPLVTWVRVDRAPFIQAQIAQLLTEPAADGGREYKPPYSNTYGPKDAWDLPRWAAEEQPAASWVLGDLGPNQKRVIAHLVAAGSDGVWTGELRRSAGYEDATTMSGVFKAISGRFRATGHRPVWNGGPKDSQKGQLLNVGDETARQLFAKVLKANHPDLAQEYGIS